MEMGELDIGPRPYTLLPKEEIVGVILQGMEVGLNRSNTLPCSMLDNVLMELGEVDLGLVPAHLFLIIWVIMVDHLIFIVMAKIEVGIGLTPANFMHITIVD